MTTLTAVGEPTGQGWVQIAELLTAFALSSVIGLERQLHGKSAGVRTQAIVGTSSALFLLVGKYGFSDVLVNSSLALDPSRVAAQIVSGIGFLGAGLIITRRGAIHGLTTAAAVWETAAIVHQAIHQPRRTRSQSGGVPSATVRSGNGPSDRRRAPPVVDPDEGG